LELKNAFNVFDVNGDGNISKKELSSVLKQLGQKLTEKQVNEMLKQADKDGDGFINFEEFKKMTQNN
jgi:Ca2+-binding EF-hand superfamily protein